MISFFIPIRENSKRIKNKSIRKIGKYKFGLTEIKINQLKKIKGILDKKKKDNVEFIVSTDSKKVKSYLKQFSWIRVHNRSKRLAKDDCLDELINEVPKICAGDIILWTHVTSPCFNEISYEKFISKYLKTKKNKYDSAFSADLINTFVMNSKFHWVSHNVRKKKWPRTQDLKKLYSVNSAAFIASRDVYLKYKNRLGKKPLPIKASGFSGFDIDETEHMEFFKKKLMR